MMPPSPLTRKKLSMVGFLNMWSFGRWGGRGGGSKNETYAKILVHMWLIIKTSLSCCQILCPFKIQPYWKVFGLPTIGGLIMCKVPFLALLMLILKTQLSLHIMVLGSIMVGWTNLPQNQSPF